MLHGGTTVAVHAVMSLSTADQGIPTDDVTYSRREQSGEHEISVAIESESECQARLLELDGPIDPADDVPSTLRVGPEENRSLLTRAFENTDDEITLESATTAVPADVSSPVGDDEIPVEHDDETRPTEAEERATESAVRQAAALAGAPANEVAPTQSHEPPSAFRSRTSEAYVSEVIRLRPRVTPEAAKAIRAARAAARRDQATTRLVVLGIWAAAAMLGGALAFFVLVSS
jgi:hypothetical protein